MKVYEILNYEGENVFHFKKHEVTGMASYVLFTANFFHITEMNKLNSERDVNFVIFFKASEKNRYLKALKEKIISKLNRKKNDIEKQIQDIKKATLL